MGFFGASLSLVVLASVLELVVVSGRFYFLILDLKRVVGDMRGQSSTEHTNHHLVHLLVVAYCLSEAIAGSSNTLNKRSADAGSDTESKDSRRALTLSYLGVDKFEEAILIPDLTVGQQEDFQVHVLITLLESGFKGLGLEEDFEGRLQVRDLPAHASTSIAYENNFWLFGWQLELGDERRHNGPLVGNSRMRLKDGRWLSEFCRNHLNNEVLFQMVGALLKSGRSPLERGILRLCGGCGTNVNRKNSKGLGVPISGNNLCGDGKAKTIDLSIVLELTKVSDLDLDLFASRDVANSCGEGVSCLEGLLEKTSGLSFSFGLVVDLLCLLSFFDYAFDDAGTDRAGKCDSRNTIVEGKHIAEFFYSVRGGINEGLCEIGA
ncbi:hypothetical protein HG530_001773 [Fusarium avenaceum]|nr:hypothetical protein HG530_001773 [Fusarium avenaceum]